MSAHLKQPQLFMNYLVPTGREKFRLGEVAQILSPDDGQAPVTVQSIRNGMEQGRLFGNRIPFSSVPGSEQRIRVEWMTRADVLHALLVSRTAPAETMVDQLAEIAARLPSEALDELMRCITKERQRRPLVR